MATVVSTTPLLRVAAVRVQCLDLSQYLWGKNRSACAVPTAFVVPVLSDTKRLDDVENLATRKGCVILTHFVGDRERERSVRHYRCHACFCPQSFPEVAIIHTCNILGGEDAG